MTAMAATSAADVAAAGSASAAADAVAVAVADSAAVAWPLSLRDWRLFTQATIISFSRSRLCALAGRLLPHPLVGGLLPDS
jgi:hypothetical protein